MCWEMLTNILLGNLQVGQVKWRNFKLETQEECAESRGRNNSRLGSQVQQLRASDDTAAVIGSREHVGYARTVRGIATAVCST